MIVGVTDGSKAQLEKFVSDYGIKYPIAVDGPAMTAYGVRSIPDSVLIGPDGKVRWKGHPSGLKDSMIEDALQGATPPLPASLARFNPLVKARKFGKLYTDLKKAVEDKKATQADAGPVIGALDDRMKGLLSDGEKARGKGEFYTAAIHLQELKNSFAGTDPSKKAADVLKEIEKDPKAKEQVKAVDTFAKLEQAMEAKAYADAYRGYKGLAKKFAGTKIETEANQQMTAIEKDRLMNYRSNCPACKKDGKTCTQHRG